MRDERRFILAVPEERSGFWKAFMSIDRRSVLLGTLGALALVGGAAPTAADIVIRRPYIADADPRYQRYATQGPFVPTENPVLVPLEEQGVNLVLYHPRNALSGRLVVFSHGALAEPQVYAALLTHWASHGFVVAAPIHDDSVIERGLIARSRDVKGHSRWEFGKLLNDVGAWGGRARSCGIVIDSVPILSRTLGIEIEAERPIIVGHDYGAYTAQILLGASVSTSEGGGPRVFADSRFFAGILLSPQGSGTMGLTPDSWNQVARPLMVAAGGEDFDAMGQDPRAKVDPFLLSPPGNKHLAWWPRGTHMMYTGQRASSSAIERLMFEDIKAVTTAFLIAYGNYVEESLMDLSGDFFERASERRVTMRYR